MFLPYQVNYLFDNFTLENGNIYGWGWNFYRQLGFKSNAIKPTSTLISFFRGMNVIDIFAGYDHSFVVLGIIEFIPLIPNQEKKRHTLLVVIQMVNWVSDRPKKVHLK